MVVPTLNGRDRLAASLDALASHAPDAEVIVVNGPSADGTTGMVRGRDDVDVLVEVSARTLNVARNAGIEVARGDAVALVRYDLAVGPEWAAELRGGLREAAAGTRSPGRRRASPTASSRGRATARRRGTRTASRRARTAPSPATTAGSRGRSARDRAGARASSVGAARRQSAPRSSAGTTREAFRSNARRSASADTSSVRSSVTATTGWTSGAPEPNRTRSGCSSSPRSSTSR